MKILGHIGLWTESHCIGNVRPIPSDMINRRLNDLPAISTFIRPNRIEACYIETRPFRKYFLFHLRN
jgi:hypothetical protein